MMGAASAGKTKRCHACDEGRGTVNGKGDCPFCGRPVTVVTLRNGLTVYAKFYKGQPTARTYANRTQAQRVANRTGGTVYGWRPFYVAPSPSLSAAKAPAHTTNQGG